jgi:hypothetical protein
MQTVNWNSSQAKKQISEIIEAEVAANAHFFKACQSLIPVLDGGCRPLLAARPGAKAVKAVAATVALLNKKSEVGPSIKLELNQEDLGTVVRKQFRPDAGNLAIQGFWEAEYNRRPDHAAAEAFWQELLAGQTRKEREEKEETRKKSLSKEQLYQKQLEEWKAEVERIKEKRAAECRRLVEEKRLSLKKEIESAREKGLSSASEQSEKAEKLIKTTKEELSALGLFKFAERGEQKKLLQAAQEMLTAASELKERTEKEYDEALAGFEKTMERAEKELEKELAKKYPLPEEPIGGYKADILKWMKYDRYTAVEIALSVPSIVADGISSSRVSAMMTQLVNAGKLFGFYEGGTMYFSKCTFVDDMLYTIDEWKELKKSGKL